jgi:hypothetical protein
MFLLPDSAPTRGHILFRLRLIAAQRPLEGSVVFAKPWLSAGVQFPAPAKGTCRHCFENGSEVHCDHLQEVPRFAVRKGLPASVRGTAVTLYYSLSSLLC